MTVPTEEPAEAITDESSGESTTSVLETLAEQNPAESTTPETTTPLAHEDRPDWLPEKHWDSEKKEIRVEAALKSYTDTQRELHRLQNGQGPDVPEDATEYLKTDRFNDDGLYVFDDEGLTVPEMGRDHPQVIAFTEVAKEIGLSQEKFDLVFAKVMGAGLEASQPSYHTETEFAKLGGGDIKDGEAIAMGAVQWIQALEGRSAISDVEAKSLLGFAANANNIRLLMKIRGMTGERQIPLGGPIDGSAIPTKAEIESMMKDPQYQSDPAFREKVAKLVAKQSPRDPENTGPEFTA